MLDLDHKEAAKLFAEKIAALGLTVEPEFVPFSKSRNAGEKYPSLNWRVTIKRQGRAVLTTDYMAGIGHAPKVPGKPTPSERHKADRMMAEGGKAVRFVYSEGPLVHTGPVLQPDPCNVISSIVQDSRVLDSGGFEDWASDYGYDKDSRKAESIYHACLEHALALKAAIGTAALEELTELASHL